MKQFTILFTMMATGSQVAPHITVASTTKSYEGLYSFTKIIDNTDTVGEVPVPIPNDGIYTIQLRPSTTIGINLYDISIKVGNSMGGTATITASINGNSEDTISIGELWSSMMMPPPELYRIEVALSDLLPAATTILIENDVVTIDGPKGSVQATRKV